MGAKRRKAIQVIEREVRREMRVKEECHCVGRTERGLKKMRYLMREKNSETNRLGE